MYGEANIIEEPMSTSSTLSKNLYKNIIKDPVNARKAVISIWSFTAFGSDLATKLYSL